MIGQRDALVVVDFQNDFCPGGALAVPEGDQIAKAVNKWLDLPWGIICATRDWHPPNHISFRPRGPWPPHCVAGTRGAEFHPAFRKEKVQLEIKKADRPELDAYSGFQQTKLAEELRRRKIRKVWVCGLATDYCVKATALDARQGGWEVAVLLDACRGVAKETTDKAISEMKQAGVQICSGSEIQN